MIKEFKAFALKGNMIDLAVGVIIGSAFGKVVSSLVTDVLMPPLGILMGGVDFSDKVLTIKKATDVSEAVNINYGLFLNEIISLLIVSFAIFMVIKQLSRLKKEKPACPPEKVEPSAEVKLLTEIRDSLKK